MPNGIPEILAYLAQTAAGYNNHLKWNEVAKLKADLMNARRRWVGMTRVATNRSDHGQSDDGELPTARPAATMNRH